MKVWNSVQIRLGWLMAVMLKLATSAAFAQVLDQLPDPDGESASLDRPNKVFVLLGQSNMLGFGR